MVSGRFDLFGYGLACFSAGFMLTMTIDYGHLSLLIPMCLALAAAAAVLFFVQWRFGR